MKLFINILFLLIVNFVFSQDIEFLEEKRVTSFKYFEVGKKKCTGIISNNNCLRFIKLSTTKTPEKNQFKSCDYDLKYNFRLDDNLVLIYDDFETLKDELKTSRKDLYNKIKSYKSYDFVDWTKVEITNKRKFMITRYSTGSIEVIRFRIKVYYLNSKILTNNILVNRDPEDFINVVIPIKS
jgi:hypothetical protein